VHTPSLHYTTSGARPSFFEVAHVDFLSPVDVGDLMRFDSCVLYTHIGDEGLPHVHVQVS
jgi:acyl-coenzyme A thioesterase 9